MTYKTCTHVHDNGHYCQSAAASGRDYCCYHLRHRGRLMRMAQARARSQRFDLRLPPLENMHAVQSALSQLVEAVAADMIDLKRAHFLLSALRQAANNFKHPDAWKPSAYQNDHSQAHPYNYNNFEAEYGLPDNLDLDAPPEVAFPPPQPAETSGAPPLSPAVGDRVGDFPGGPQLPSLDRAPLFPDIPAPYVRDYTAEAEAAMFEATPEDIELNEILKEQGYKAFDRRAKEHQRNADRRKQRKLFRANYERYAAEAKAKNIQRAAEKLIAEKLAAAKPQPVSTTADETSVSASTRKPPTHAADVAVGPEEAKKTA